MPNLIISTCGTSILTRDVNQDKRRLLTQLTNSKENELEESKRQEIDQWINQRLEILIQGNEKNATFLSAELNGLLTYYRENRTEISRSPQDIHWFLVSDTYLGQKAFEIISKWLNHKYQINTEKVSANGLNTNNLGDFRLALSDIMYKFLHEMKLRDWQEKGYNTVFNLTGGFKSVNGFLQAAGMLIADECFYLFEGSQEIMRVPKLPIKRDLEIFEGNPENLLAVRKMAKKMELKRSDCGNLPSTLLFEVEDKVLLSEWGTTLWLEVNEDLYGKDLMLPLSDKLFFSENFKDQVKNSNLFADSQRINVLNKRLDDLAICLDSNQKLNPNSLDFKTIKGKPNPKRSHEFDVWSDRENRGYGYFQTIDGKNKFVVESIDNHL